jgi:hypothetical protein
MTGRSRTGTAACGRAAPDPEQGQRSRRRRGIVSPERVGGWRGRLRPPSDIGRGRQILDRRANSGPGWVPASCLDRPFRQGVGGGPLRRRLLPDPGLEWQRLPSETQRVARDFPPPAAVSAARGTPRSGVFRWLSACLAALQFLDELRDQVGLRRCRRWSVRSPGDDAAPVITPQKPVVSPTWTGSAVVTAWQRRFGGGGVRQDHSSSGTPVACPVCHWLCRHAHQEDVYGGGRVLALGHLEELTQIVPSELAEGVWAATAARSWAG